MEMNVIVRAYEVVGDTSPDVVKQTLIATALGSRLTLNGIHEVSVLTSSISFVLTLGVYNLSSAITKAYDAVANVEEIINAAENVDATINGTTFTVTNRNGVKSSYNLATDVQSLNNLEIEEILK